MTDDRAGADLYVLQPGVRDLTAGTSQLPLSTVDVVRADPGVTRAAPVRSAYMILQLHGTKVAPYVIGSLPGQHGGVWSLAAGRASAADDEIVPDRSSPVATASGSVTPGCAHRGAAGPKVLNRLIMASVLEIRDVGPWDRSRRPPKLRACEFTFNAIGTATRGPRPRGLTGTRLRSPTARTGSCAGWATGQVPTSHESASWAPACLS